MEEMLKVVSENLQPTAYRTNKMTPDNGLTSCSLIASGSYYIDPKGRRWSSGPDYIN